MQNVHSNSSPGFLPAQSGNVPITMSSREIAELCEKEHKHVLRDIRAMLVGLYGDDHIAKVMPESYRNRHSEFVRENADDILSALLKDGPNRDHLARAFRWERDKRGYVSAIFLDREHTYTLVAGYNVKLRKRIIDRWMELEASERTLTPAEMLFEQARMMVEVERKQAALEVAQVEQSQRIATTERRLDQVETATDHFTCVGYARWAKQTSINLKDAADLGRRATKWCRELGIPISKIPDPRFGYVNQFPKAILDEAWDEKFGAAS